MRVLLLIILGTLLLSCSHQRKYPFEEVDEEYVIEGEEVKKKKHHERIYSHDIR